MSLARTNKKTVEQLRDSLDIEATQAALDQGKITPIQARNIVKWIVAVKDIRENPVYPVQAKTGQFVGEIVARGGKSWLARRYGKDYPNDTAEFAKSGLIHDWSHASMVSTWSTEHTARRSACSSILPRQLAGIT